jgi:hypothetical protein
VLSSSAVSQREILDPLSLDILDGKFGEGDRIEADAQGAAGPGETDHLVFRKA